MSSGFRGGTTKSVMAWLGLSLMIVALLFGLAHAEVAVTTGVPFTAGELSVALALRGAKVDDIVVRAVSRTVVELRTAVGRHRVDLGTARGPAAARLVALQLAPLGAELDVAARPAIATGIAVTAPANGTGWRLGVVTGGGHGAAVIDFALTALRVEATRQLGPWRWGAGVSWLHGLAKSPDSTDPATADLGIVHAIAGFAVGGLEVVAGPELVPYRVTAAAPGVTIGAGGSVRVRIGGGRSWQAIASAEADALLHQVIIERDGVPFAATPRVALTAGIGFAWGAP